jgi:hypothetical protein
MGHTLRGIVKRVSIGLTLVALAVLATVYVYCQSRHAMERIEQGVGLEGCVCQWTGS